MNYPLERRHQKRESKTFYEVIDVELGQVFYCETKQLRDDYETTIQNVGHRFITKEIKSL